MINSVDTALIYCGIGSRSTPKSVQFLMTIFAYTFKGTLRSGGADGADLAFEMGAADKEIYLPSRKFNDNDSNLIVTEFPNFHEIEEIASIIHPKWSACSDYAKLLHSRNVCQVLGQDLETPSELVVCWTQDGANNRTSNVSRNTGGTGTAITLAKQFDILVLNIKNTDDLAGMVELANGEFIENFMALTDTLHDNDLAECLDLLQSIGI